MTVMGIDVGSTGCKAILLNPSGQVSGSAYCEYDAPSPASVGHRELDAEHVWSCVQTVMAQCCARQENCGVTAICVTSFGEAVVPVDQSGRPLDPAMLYTDVRGEEQAHLLEEKIPRDTYLRIAGVYPHAMYSLAKIMWIKEHAPHVYNQTAAFLPFDSFILTKLGAPPHMDYSLAARTMAFDVVNKRWSCEILSAADVDAHKFPGTVLPGTVVGEIASDMAGKIGIPRNALLVAGAHDQVCCALGMGVLEEGVASVSLGSVESINTVFARPLLHERMAKNAFACVPYVRNEMYITYAFTFTAGRLFKWYRDVLGGDARRAAKEKVMDVYAWCIETMAPSARDMMVLPYFAGAATPYMDNDIRGAFVGMDLETSQPEIVRALLEGITFESMLNAERLREAGTPVEKLRVTGGLARSPRFLQMKADMMGIPLQKVQGAEAGTLGAAMLAGIAAGAFGSLEDAATQAVRLESAYEPDFAQTQRYAERFERYKRIYPAIKQI